MKNSLPKNQRISDYLINKILKKNFFFLGNYATDKSM